MFKEHSSNALIHIRALIEMCEEIQSGKELGDLYDLLLTAEQQCEAVLEKYNDETA